MSKKMDSFIPIFVVLFAIFTSIICYKVFIKKTSLTIYSFIQQADGLGRQSIDLINMLEGKNIDINFIGKINSTNDLSDQVKSVLRNKNYNAVTVPDKNLVSIYETSGVNIPIFMAPLSIDLKNKGAL